ncbi:MULTISPECIES: hypothetical protein [unclassified Bradyrhizobium]|uniref:hypothetical protein n=1 Tax=unclassified Bradyrhizobium TaxID=2631580 RepID=UPI002916F897|nr:MULTISPECIES: hypothetical protein [unclassified Bradyrhizobium]
MRYAILLSRLLVGLIILAGRTANAADPNYKYGTVWDISLIQVEAGHGDAYLDSIKSYYTTVLELAIKRDVVKSYKILIGSRANSQDWDFMIMTEYPRWGSFDSGIVALDAIAAQVYGANQKAEGGPPGPAAAAMPAVQGWRVYGNKVLQEVHFQQ